MKQVLLVGLLTMGVTSCGPHVIQGPSGCQITGPTIQGHSFTYAVTGFRPEDEAMRQFLTSIAYGSLSGAEEEGTYTISFVDKRIGVAVWGKRGHVIIDEMDRRHKISLD